jgi:hypothetical protein
VNCAVCGEVLHPPVKDISSTHNALTFNYTEYIPYQLRPEAYAAIKTAFVKGGKVAKAHVECCFELKPAVPAVTGPVQFRIVPKKSAA